MREMLNLAAPGRLRGYTRGQFQGDVIYSSFRHGDVRLALSGGAVRVEDLLTARMLREGVIDAQQKAACDARICREFSSRELIARFDDMPVEALGRFIHTLRREVLGEEALMQAQENAAKSSRVLETVEGIDQRDKKEALLNSAAAMIFLLQEAQFAAQLRADVMQAQQLGKAAYVLCSGTEGGALPTQGQLRRWLKDCADAAEYLEADARGIQGHDALKRQISQGAACLMAYGEDALLTCRGLLVDAVVHARPEGYFAQGLVNSLDSVRDCVVYVPSLWDITPYVPLRERTRLSYWQLWQLQKDYGDDIYRCSPEEMYRRYPQYFINIYQNGSQCMETEPACPLRVVGPEDGDAMAQHDLMREETVKAFLNGFENLQAQTCYFDEQGERKPLPYGTQTQAPGILVHAVRVKKARQAQVISCREGATPRQMFARGQTGVLSNYLFFMTPKLSALYNDLRSDRRREQADVTAGHLDYKLNYEDGRRVETFPLFAKMCMAKKENGEFLFFNFRLGGGSVRVGDQVFSWSAGQVNPKEPQEDVCVFTPYLSKADGGADRQTYRRMVGAGRVNLVILQDRIHCLRLGDVVLPSVGVVISLRESTAQALLAGLESLEDGYFDVEELPLSVQLDPPEGIAQEEWQKVRWAYGGGLSLIQHGRALSDETDMDAWFTQEGWMSPLSRQTQESALHTLSRHPRTAIGQTKNGDMVMLVFSGRSKLSVGADYYEMCRLARRMYPDIQTLMNVDGGASAALCMVRDGVLMEMSCPSTSTGSCAGMVRPIKTMLYIPAE